MQQRLGEAAIVELVAAYAAGAPSTQLAKQYEIGRGAVLRLLRDSGMPVRRQGLNDIDATEGARLYRDGWSLAKVAEKLNVSPNTVRTRLLDAGIVMRSPHERVDRSG